MNDYNPVAELTKQQGLLAKAKAGLVNMTTLCLFAGTIATIVAVFTR